MKEMSKKLHFDYLKIRIYRMVNNNEIFVEGFFLHS